MKVLLGMSGGTDSSVAAMLLAEQGFEVVGVTFRFWDDGRSAAHLEDAVTLAGRLGIEHVVYDAREVFRDVVVRYFVDEYMAGRTPFPCALCNNELKWPLLFREAERLGCDRVATGHYARIWRDDDGRCFIAEGADPDKDQSFFLWGLSGMPMERIIFPLGGYTKAEVRALARERGFRLLAEKKDSLGVCFCPGDYHSFLRSQLPNADTRICPGDFVDESGRVLGRHAGYPLYTVGQRRGLVYLNRAVFVKEIVPRRNEVVLAPLASLYKTEFYVRDYRVVDRDLFSDGFDTVVRIRYRKQNTPGRISFVDGSRLRVELAEPLESVAPGQTAVFYRNGRVLGGGFIE